MRQLTIQGPSGKTIRPDLILYVNGLPLVVIELTDPANAAADLNMAIDQFGRYKETTPDLFVPNLLLVVSDGLLTRVGSITSERQRFTPWRPATGGEPTLEALIGVSSGGATGGDAGDRAASGVLSADRGDDPQTTGR